MCDFFCLEVKSLITIPYCSPKSNCYARFQCCNSYFVRVSYLVPKSGTSTPPPKYNRCIVNLNSNPAYKSLKA